MVLPHQISRQLRLRAWCLGRFSCVHISDLLETSPTVHIPIEWRDLKLPDNFALWGRIDEANIFHQFNIIALPFRQHSVSSSKNFLGMKCLYIILLFPHHLEVSRSTCKHCIRAQEWSAHRSTISWTAWRAAAFFRSPS